MREGLPPFGPPARPAPARVDPRLAHEVAESFLAESSRPADPVVGAAYGQLQHQSDRLFALITGPHCGHAVHVAFTRCPNPYSSDAEMIRAIRHQRQLEVTTAAADPDRRHPLMDCTAGGGYDRFRAVHDVLGHARHCFGFDRDGEFAAWLEQERTYAGLARWALATELHAEHSVRWTTGNLAEHKALLLDTDLLRRSRRAGQRQLAQ